MSPLAHGAHLEVTQRCLIGMKDKSRGTTLTDKCLCFSRELLHLPDIHLTG